MTTGNKVFSSRHQFKLMKSIQFLKPDLKRIIVLLIILIPLLVSKLSPFTGSNLPYPAQFYVWDIFISLWGTIVMIPFVFFSIIFFGGWDVGGGLFPYSNISDSVMYLIGSIFWYVISCVIVTVWDGLIKSKSFGKISKKNEKAIMISLITVFVVLVIIMPTIATSSIVMEKTTRQNISMEELLYVWSPEKQPVREDVRLQEIRIKNNFIFPASYQLPDVTACMYDTEKSLILEYSVSYKTEDGRSISDMNSYDQNIIIVQPYAETRVYLCKFLGINPSIKPDYENCNQVLLFTNVGMDNHSYCDYVTEEDILRSEKIKILK